MHSSTSSSRAETAAPTRGRPTLIAGAALVAAIVAFLLVLEVLARAAVPRASKIEGRITSEYRGATLLRPGTNGARSLLVVGNSLLDAGVDFPALSEALGRDRIAASRLVVEGTGYLDWRAAIERLLQLGSKPDVIALALTFEQLTGKGFRGSYSAHRLMSLPQVLRVAHELELGNTEISGLLLSHVSAFYGLREEIRKQVVSLLVPGLPLLTAKLAARPRGSDEHRFSNTPLAIERLAALRKVTDAAGVKLVVIEPPAPVPEPSLLLERIRQAADVSRVEILVPVGHAELPSSLYSDGYHLTAEGAAIFTAKLSRELARAIDRPAR